MSRSLQEIYEQIIAEKNRRLELTEHTSTSKVSIMNSIAYVVANAISASETLMDVFASDVSKIVNDRINGTPQYYANALLKYQQGDELEIREDGLSFGYKAINPSKRIITQVSYNEGVDDVNVDAKLVLKVATGENGDLKAISKQDLVPIQAYINQIKFAGVRIEVVSREGDVLIPKVSVYYNGRVNEDEQYSLIEAKLKEYLTTIKFDDNIYVSEVVELLRSVENVTDVYIDADNGQGIFLAQYTEEGRVSKPTKINRVAKTWSGYLKESSKAGLEADLPSFRESISLFVEKQE